VKQPMRILIAMSVSPCACPQAVKVNASPSSPSGAAGGDCG
jgi:hypothetical protein